MTAVRAAIAQAISNYDELVEKAITLANSAPFYKVIDCDDVCDLALDGDDLIITWKEYESDYYGGGSLSEQTYAIPYSLLSMSLVEIAEMDKRERGLEAERARKVRAAQLAVAKERQEIEERHLLTVLKAKYERSV